MKKIVSLSLLSFCIVIIIAFTLMPKTIKPYRVSSGFIDLSELEEIRPFPPEALLVTTIDEWKSYTKKYLVMTGPASSMEDKSILIITIPSEMDYKQATDCSYNIKNIKKRGNELIVYVNLNKEPKINSSKEIKSLFQEVIWLNSNAINKDTKIKILKDY